MTTVVFSVFFLSALHFVDENNKVFQLSIKSPKTYTILTNDFFLELTVSILEHSGYKGFPQTANGCRVHGL